MCIWKRRRSRVFAYAASANFTPTCTKRDWNARTWKVFQSQLRVCTVGDVGYAVCTTRKRCLLLILSHVRIQLNWLVKERWTRTCVASHFFVNRSERSRHYYCIIADRLRWCDCHVITILVAVVTQISAIGLTTNWPLSRIIVGIGCSYVWNLRRCYLRFWAIEVDVVLNYADSRVCESAA